MERAYRASTRLMGAVTFLLGLIMVVATVARGGGPFAVGVVVGLLFAIVGAARYAGASRGK